MKRNRIEKNGFKRDTAVLTSMLLPAVVLTFVFMYIPMFGIIIAFKDFKFNLGILGSSWNGLNNFVFLFKSKTMFTLVRNTLGYNIIGLIVENAVPIFIAICLERITSKRVIKLYQGGMFIPYFLSWVVVSYFSLALFDYESGLINEIIAKFGGNKISFYESPKYWPVILVLFKLWKGMGYTVLIYYGSLLSVDTTIYEAAAVDGCTYFKRVIHITLPHLVYPCIILMLLSLGSIFKSDYGLYYFIPKDTGALLKVTDVFDTYILRALKNATNIGLSSAMAFIQSVVGLVFVLVGNTLARKVDPDCSLF